MNLVSKLKELIFIPAMSCDVFCTVCMSAVWQKYIWLVYKSTLRDCCSSGGPSALLLCINLVTTTQVLLLFIFQTTQQRTINLCGFAHQMKCVFLCSVNRQRRNHLLCNPDVGPESVETHQHSGQFPMLSYPAMCAEATVQARAGEAPYFIT